MIKNAPQNKLDKYSKYFLQLSDKMPDRVKNSFFESNDENFDREKMGNQYFDKVNPRYRDALVAHRNYLRNAYFSIISMLSVISHVEMCARMIKRYPWHGTDISKGDHFDFVWSNFVNHCYIFEERAKQAGKHLNQLIEYNRNPKIDAGSWVKIIKKELGEYIVFRGRHIHEWARNHETYEEFKHIDLLSKYFSKYESRQKNLYRLTKAKLEKEILNTRDTMIEILLNLEPDPVELVIGYLRGYDNILSKYELVESPSQ